MVIPGFPTEKQSDQSRRTRTRGRTHSRRTRTRGRTSK